MAQTRQQSQPDATSPAHPRHSGHFVIFSPTRRGSPAGGRWPPGSRDSTLSPSRTSAPQGLARHAFPLPGRSENISQRPFETVQT
eukprot:3086949-Prymnesium_polylepis.1